MGVTVEFSFPADAHSRLACILDCTKEDEAIRDATIAEYIRACVYQPYHRLEDWGRPRSVHTNRILSAIRRDVSFLWQDIDHLPSKIFEDDNDGQYAKDVLRRLGAIGDIVKLGGGFWASGPVRIVRATDSGESALLVIGGVPFEALQTKFAERVSCVGCARFLCSDTAILQRLQVEHELQSVQDWLGGPSENLSAWTRRVLRSLVAHMSPALDLETDDSEIYAPDNILGKPNRSNWIPIKEFSVVPTGLRLCRPPFGKVAIYDRPTYLAELRNDSGRAVFHRLAQVPADIRLRLMFGFEQMQGVKRNVLFKVKGQIFRANIPFKLPEPESRIIDFGWPVGKDSQGRTNTFDFSSKLMPFFIQVMTRLNIQIINKDS